MRRERRRRGWLLCFVGYWVSILTADIVDLGFYFEVCRGRLAWCVSVLDRVQEFLLTVRFAVFIIEINVPTFRGSAVWLSLERINTQRELISAQMTQPQRLESATVTLTWYTSKYKVYKLYQRYTLSFFFKACKIRMNVIVMDRYCSVYIIIVWTTRKEGHITLVLAEMNV